MSNGIKDVTYEIEDKYLSPYAFKSRDTAGRVIPVEECKIRTEFQRDRDRIIHCKAFRRLKHKTQVSCRPKAIITERVLRTPSKCRKSQGRSGAR